MADKIPMVSYRDYTKSNVSKLWFWETTDPTIQPFLEERASFEAQGKIIGAKLSVINELTTRYSTFWDCLDSLYEFAALPAHTAYQQAQAVYNQANEITRSAATIEPA